MENRYLTILEVSQKQAYIFASNKLRDNIVNSAIIAWIMSAEYFEEVIKDTSIFSKENNLVYSGGGHTVLEFETEEKAYMTVKKITTAILKEYSGIEVFATTMSYDEKEAPGENLKKLTKQLEQKKSTRSLAFHQGSFGVEKIDSNTLKPIMVVGEKNEVVKSKMPLQEEKIDAQLSPEGFQRVYSFEDLGGSKGNSNFIAVVHIDGNAMGKRIENIYKKIKEKNQNVNVAWNTYKTEIRKFSESIDEDFKSAYKDMVDKVVQNIESNNLEQLDIQNKKFPVRRIITAGDDICFVTEGRIGIECAVAFIKALSQKKNKEDNENYSACAGVAIVHQKYPFYKAYELAELLCSNAKKFGASLSLDKSGKDVSAIDWHIEFGELKDTLEEIRSDYKTEDGKRLELRPYIVTATKEIEEKESIRQYSKFKKLITNIQNQNIDYAKGKLKELRSILKLGETESLGYIQFNKIEDIALEGYQDVFVELDYNVVKMQNGLERKIFVSTEDGESRSILFDAIELLDTYIELDRYE